jgi:hypothetical protein
VIVYTSLNPTSLTTLYLEDNGFEEGKWAGTQFCDSIVSCLWQTFVINDVGIAKRLRKVGEKLAGLSTGED